MYLIIPENKNKGAKITGGGFDTELALDVQKGYTRVFDITDTWEVKELVVYSTEHYSWVKVEML